MGSVMQKLCCILILFVLLIVFVCISFVNGTVEIPLGSVFEYLLFPDDSVESFIVHETRLPRIFAAVCIGAALSLSGALYQGVIGNPLVSPGILGVLSGASFGAALGMLLGYSLTSVEILSFIFGVMAMLIALGMSFLFDRGRSLLMLILAGILTSSMFGAGVSILKLLADPYNKLPNIVYWLMGSLTFVDSVALVLVSLALCCCFVYTFYCSRTLDVLSLHEDSASALGVDILRSRIIFLGCATLLASFSVAIGGLIGWVGLVIPHAARFLVGASHRFLLPCAALLGASFLLLCDTLARCLADSEIPIGIMTSILGIPLFSVLLLVQRRFS